MHEPNTLRYSYTELIMLPWIWLIINTPPPQWNPWGTTFISISDFFRCRHAPPLPHPRVDIDTDRHTDIPSTFLLIQEDRPMKKTWTREGRWYVCIIRLSWAIIRAIPWLSPVRWFGVIGMSHCLLSLHCMHAWLPRLWMKPQATKMFTWENIHV